MWYSGRKPGAPAVDVITPSSGNLGVRCHDDAASNTSLLRTTRSTRAIFCVWSLLSESPPNHVVTVLATIISIATIFNGEWWMSRYCIRYIF